LGAKATKATRSEEKRGGRGGKIERGRELGDKGDQKMVVGVEGGKRLKRGKWTIAGGVGKKGKVGVVQKNLGR